MTSDMRKKRKSNNNNKRQTNKQTVVMKGKRKGSRASRTAPTHTHKLGEEVDKPVHHSAGALNSFNQYRYTYL